jgi:hypothetical protein
MVGYIKISPTAPTGNYSFNVINPQNITTNTVNGFTVNKKPSLLSVAPNTAIQGQSLNVTITGINTNFSNTYNKLKFFTQGTESFDFYYDITMLISNNIISYHTTVSPYAHTGIYSIGVENEIDGLVMLENSFNVISNNKSISSILPNRGKQNETLTVSITGINTQFNTGSPTIYFMRQGSPTSDIEAISFYATSATVANAQIRIASNTDLGLYDIGYFNLNDGTVFKPNAFTVDLANSINEIAENTTKIFPNPAKNLLNIESTNNISSIHIFDLMGKEILNKIPEKQTQNLQIDLSEILIPKGIYFIKVQSLEGLVAQKIVIE